MKLLVLGGSRLFARPGIKEGQQLNGAARDVPRGPGELDFTVVAKMTWPNERLPALVNEWVRDEEPDIVLLAINDAWYNYEAIPLRKVKKKGPLGRFLNHSWRIAAEREWVANSALLHRGRRRLANVTGASPEFTPEEVIASVGAVLRTILRVNEDQTVLVCGPFTDTDGPYTGKVLERRLARRRQVNAGVARLCATLHTEHIGLDHPAMANRPRPTFLGDGLHTDPAGNRAEALFWRSVLAPYVFKEFAKKSANSTPGATPTR